MSKKQSRLSAMIVILMLVSLLAACSSSKDTSQSAETGKADGGASSKQTTPENSGDGKVYPLKTDKTLSYWMPFPGNVNGVKSKLDDIPFFQEWQKRTGVKLKLTSPAINQEKEALNVMLASGELPDMIEYNWADFPGGPEKAIKDGYILKLNDLIDKYAPNLKKYLKEHPDFDKQIKTDDGSYYVFPFIRGDSSLLVFNGPVIRQDWLDKVKLPVPVTIDDWYATLKAFKDQLGVQAPLTFESTPTALSDLNNGAFVGAFGINRGFYIDDNKEVQFGPIQPQYKDFLATFRKWYAEGLIDKNIATVDRKTEDADIASGISGATITYAGSGIGKLTPTLVSKDANAKLVAAPYPVLKKGDKPMFGQMDFPYAKTGSVAITTTSKNPQLAAQMLDFAYSDEGHMFFNFGTEGVSYNMVDGYPKYSDLLMKNPDNLAPAQAMSLYIRANYNGPFVQDKRYIEQYYTMQSQRDAAFDIWNTDMAKHQMLPVSATPDESSELASIMNDVQTAVDEMSLKIILGAEPLDSFDSYVSKIKSLNIERALEIERSALKRYNSR